MTLTYDPCAEPPLLPWDTAWDDACGDWKMDGIDLRDDAQLHTAIVLCLFTDRRARDDDQLPGDDDDRRGWFGDFVDVRTDLFEQELGSFLWLHERGVLNETTRLAIEGTARESLQVLVDQGIAASITVSAAVSSYPNGNLTLTVQVFSEEGTLRYDQKFSRIWDQTISSR